MAKSIGLILVVAALASASAAGAQPPPAQLLHAEQQTAHARSLRLAMTMTMRIGGQKLQFSATGRERPQAHQASMTVDFGKLDPAIGQMQVIAIGSRFYVHYDFLQALGAKQAQVKPWVLMDSAATAGFDPWSLSNLSTTMKQASGFRLVGSGPQGSRYRADIDLQHALASNPQLKQLLARLGTAAASSLPSKPVSVELDVGSDGYLHRTSEAFTMTVGGVQVASSVAITMSDFNADSGPLVAPPASQVMTLSQFKRLVKP